MINLENIKTKINESIETTKYIIGTIFIRNENSSWKINLKQDNNILGNIRTNKTYMFI